MVPSGLERPLPISSRREGASAPPGATGLDARPLAVILPLGRALSTCRSDRRIAWLWWCLQAVL